MSSVRRAYLISGISYKFRREHPALYFKKYERRMSNNILPFDFRPPNFDPLKYVKDKFDKVMKFYHRLTGWEELRLAQEKVEEAGQKLVKMQEERRNAFATLLEIQNKLKGIYSQLENTKRGDGRYIQLITEEHNLLKNEEMQQEKFKIVERAEREHFTLFSLLVKNIHEKEKYQSQKAKYMSIIGSFFGTIVGIVISSINTHKSKLELKKLIAESSNSNLETQLNKFINAYKETDNAQDKLFHEIDIKNKILNDLCNKNTDVDGSEMHKYLNEVLVKTNNILLNLEETMKIIKLMPEFQIYKLQANDKAADKLVMNLESFKRYMHYQNEDMKAFLLKSCLYIFGGVVLTRLIF